MSNEKENKLEGNGEDSKIEASKSSSNNSVTGKSETKKKDPKKEKGKIASIISTYRGEFRQIVWPSRPELVRKTITVVVISALFGVYIAVLDGLLSWGFTGFVGFLG